MSLIDSTYFNGELSIGQLENSTVANTLQIFITKYEKVFLYSLLGKTLADQFTAGLLIDPIDSKWTALKAQLISTSDKTSPIANYVYYYYLLDDITKTTGAGQVKSDVLNGMIVSANDKMVKVWNDMVRPNRYFSKWIDENPTDYPYDDREHCDYLELMHFKNTLNI